MTLNIEIPRRGFQIGEVIPIFAEISNFARRQINFVKICLLQYQLYKGQSYWANFPDTVKEEVEISSYQLKQPIRPGQTKKIHDKLQIPDAIPGELKSCQIIDITYEILFHIGKSIKYRMPIRIGTEPVKYRIERFDNRRIEARASCAEADNFEGTTPT